MGGGMAGQPLHGFGHIQKLGNLWIVFLHLSQLAVFFQSLFNRNILSGVHWNFLGHLIYCIVGHIQGSSHIAHRTSGGHGTKGNNLGHMICAIFPDNIINDFLSSFITEIAVDIRHRDSFRI